MSKLTLENVDAFYGKAQALKDVSLNVENGQIVAIVGANGAGKSTLLDSILGMTRCMGQIMLDGTDVTGKSTAHMIKNGLGYAPERFHLFPHMTVLQNLLVGAYTARGDVAANLEKVYRLFPRLAERKHQEPATQSGGERQMVSLGRALMSSPRLLLVDEPTIGLAPKVCGEIAKILQLAVSDLGLTLLITEQNAKFALSLAEKLYVLDAGTLVASGTPEELSSDEKLAQIYFGM